MKYVSDEKTSFIIAFRKKEVGEGDRGEQQREERERERAHGHNSVMIVGGRVVGGGGRGCWRDKW